MTCLAFQITLEVSVVVTTLHMLRIGETTSGTLMMTAAAQRHRPQESSQTQHTIYSTEDVAPLISRTLTMSNSRNLRLKMTSKSMLQKSDLT